MIGIDTTSIDRIQKACDRFGQKFLSRLLSPSEIALCTHSTQSFNIQRIAGFWCAKEAISKALGVGIGKELGFLDIVLSKDSKGKPQATLAPKKLKDFGISGIAVSITHNQNLAIATALVIKEKK